jgi:hypothetical protein
MSSNCNSHWNLSLNHIQSITFNIELHSINKYQRITLITEILDALPNLSHLVVAWKDFRHCSRKYTNLRRLHLIIDGQYNNPNPECFLNLRRLTQLTPYLNCLETSDAIMMLNENLVEFILNIIRQFDQLIHLILNKNINYRTKDQKKLLFINKLNETTHDQIFHFQFRRYDELRIWV